MHEHVHAKLRSLIRSQFQVAASLFSFSNRDLALDSSDALRPVLLLTPQPAPSIGPLVRIAPRSDQGCRRYPLSGCRMAKPNRAARSSPALRRKRIFLAEKFLLEKGTGAIVPVGTVPRTASPGDGCGALDVTLTPCRRGRLAEMATILASSPKHDLHLLLDRRSVADCGQGVSNRRPRQARRTTSALPALGQSCRSRRIVRSRGANRNIVIAGSIWQCRLTAGSSQAPVSVSVISAAARPLQNSPAVAGNLCGANFFKGARHALPLETPPTAVGPLGGEMQDRAPNIFSSLQGAPSDPTPPAIRRRMRRSLRNREACLPNREVSCAFSVRFGPSLLCRE